MMSKSNASKMRWHRALYILPLVCGALALNARTVTDCKVSEFSSVATDNNSTIRVELSKDSEGDYRFFVMDKSVTFDELFDTIRSMMNGDESAIVEIMAPSDCRIGIIDDIKQGLREIPALKVNYRIPDCGSTTRDLPPSKEAAEKAGITYKNAWESIQSQPKENVHYVLINENDRVLFGTTLINIESLMECVADVVRNNHKYIIVYRVNRGTSFGAYVTAQKEIFDAVNIVRNEYSSEKFGKSFDALNDEERMTVLNEIPICIYEIEAKKSTR